MDAPQLGFIWCSSWLEFWAGTSQKWHCSSQCLPSGGFHLLHYWWCSLWSFWWCFKFLHRKITAESDSFSICDEKVFCGEALWNYISIPFGIKFSLPPPPFPLSQTRLLVSYFVQWIIICYSYDLFWHAEYSRFDHDFRVLLIYLHHSLSTSLLSRITSSSGLVLFLLCPRLGISFGKKPLTLEAKC